MIIRRKHTANFTTIGNALFNDERLAADEVGVIAGLLSKPHDWEVRRKQLQNRWRLGRDSIKRIIHSAMRTGWIVACKTRLPNGTFHIIYEVRDTPGPELSDDEIKVALSVVSTGASQDEADDDEGQEGATDESKPPTENPSRSADEPSLAEPSTVNPSRPEEILQSTDSQRKESTKAVCAYVDVKAKWPSANVLSDVAAQTAFLDLTDEQKSAAFAGAVPYLNDCEKQGRKVCDLTTYFRERRWERFQSKERPSLVVVPFGTPQFYRWLEYRVNVLHENRERLERAAKNNGGMAVASEWPPAAPSQKSA